MKRFWVDARKWDKSIVTSALESGAEAVVVNKGVSDSVRELGLIKTVAPDGDLVLGRDVFEVEIKSKKDELEASKLGKKGIVIVTANDWTIIPLENLIASGAQVIAHVSSLDEAEVALEVLEKGVAGVLLETSDVSLISKVGKLVIDSECRVELVTGKITRIEAVGSGDRACVDTCTNMIPGQGMLVGNTSSGMFLVHSESIDNPYVAARPFRVNAGGVHAYIMVAGGKTKYLSELEAGDKVMVVGFCGKSLEAAVGRNKIERRPMMLVEAKARGTVVSLILQNAETIRLMSPKGDAISIVKLKVGDEVLCHVEDAGRHFGMKVDEKINEK